MNGHDDESTWVEHTLVRLGESQFRAKFVLSEADRSYARDKGRHVIDRHAHEMLRARRPLTYAEVNRLADLVMAWIDRDLTNHPARDAVAGARSAQADARRVKAAHAKAPRYVQPEL